MNRDRPVPGSPAARSGDLSGLPECRYLVLHGLLKLPAAEWRPEHGVWLLTQRTLNRGCRSDGYEDQAQLPDGLAQLRDQFAGGDIENGPVDYDNVGVECAASFTRRAATGEVPSFNGAQLLQMGYGSLALRFVAMQYKDLHAGQLRPNPSCHG